ncbi:hypothetical protein BFS06_11455 [Clostridium perfringens]|uniref:Uncharacterized protein n=1 Tax=Clostridium perfringens TaxID=1502 RepID=A0A140GS00_CLOPF|nr:hypothetical protein [Clostridium perfringens]AMN31309.1 hypothetical protein JFP838_pA0393 [Clostridium perfringens]TBX14831.1 hypothetical protein BFS06_11455 [Clostridium perfringens]
MDNKINVFVCENCNFEDSLIIPGVKLDKNEDFVCPKCGEVVKYNIVKMDKGCGLSLKDYNELLVYIKKNHDAVKGMGKRIKYVNPIIDMRTLEIYSIKIGNKNFSVVNENKHKNLKEWIYNYLDN